MVSRVAKVVERQKGMFFPEAHYRTPIKLVPRWALYGGVEKANSFQ